MNKRRKLSRKQFLYLVREQQLLYKELYIDRDLTARKVAENQNIHYESFIPKVLHQVLGSKQMGHGGKRVGSGNKKGVKICGGCMRKRKDCTGETELCISSEKLVADLQQVVDIVSGRDKKIIQSLIEIEIGIATREEESKKFRFKSDMLRVYRLKFIRGQFPKSVYL